MWLILETLDDGAGAYNRWTSFDSYTDCYRAWFALMESPPANLVAANWLSDVYPVGRYP
jgi:hypothetical protein